MAHDLVTTVLTDLSRPSRGIALNIKVCVCVRACVRVDVDSSVGLSAGIQSAGDSVPDTLRVRILHYTEEDNSLACARASKLTTTNMYIAKARCECQTAVGWSGQNAP